MAVDVVNKKSNLILYRVNGNKTKRVAVYNLHTNKENYFSNGDTKITINIGPKIADNYEYFVQIRPGTIKSVSSGATFPGIEAGYQEPGGIWFSTGNNNAPLTIEGTTPVQRFKFIRN